jgi:hypothetical protein
MPRSKLIRDTITFLQQNYKPKDTILSNQDQARHFQPAPKKASRDMTAEIKQMVAHAAPHLEIKEEIPDDLLARGRASLWKQQLHLISVAVVGFDEKDNPFLKQLAKAIDTGLATAKWIDGIEFEKQKKWELLLQQPKLKLILAPDRKTWSNLSLLQYYREIPPQTFLGKTALFVLQPTLNYLKNPQLKPQLWKAVRLSLSS